MGEKTIVQAKEVETVSTLRSIFKLAGVGEIATTAAPLLGGGSASAVVSTVDVAPIIPPQIANRASAPLPNIDFPMTGGSLFARACKAKGVAAMFCCPGNYEVIHAINNHGIPSFSGRNEGAMASPADAFIWATGEIAVCSGTEGPGFLNMIGGLAGAYLSHSPMLFVASSKSFNEEGTQSGIQLMYQQSVPEGIKKYGKLTQPERLARSSMRPTSSRRWVRISQMRLARAVGVRLGAGPQAAHKEHPVLAITGDASFGYSGMEIETMAKYRLPVVNIVYNNNSWGAWYGQRDEPAQDHLHLFQENPRYDRMAEALGGHGEFLTAPDQFLPALQRACDIAAESNCQAKKEFWLRDQYAPGFLGKVEPGVMPTTNQGSAIRRHVQTRGHHEPSECNPDRHPKLLAKRSIPPPAQAGKWNRLPI